MNQQPLICPHCLNDDSLMLEPIRVGFYFCSVCGRTFTLGESNDSKREGENRIEDSKEEI
jgi:transposase-like protein